MTRTRVAVVCIREEEFARRFCGDEPNRRSDEAKWRARHAFPGRIPTSTLPTMASTSRSCPTATSCSILESEIGNTVALLRRTPAARADFAYAPGKWTVKEVVGHMTDVERVMGFRALWFARQDAQPLPGFDENAWVPSGQLRGALAVGSHGRVSGGALVDDVAGARTRPVDVRTPRYGERRRRSACARCCTSSPDTNGTTWRCSRIGIRCRRAEHVARRAHPKAA